MLLSTKDACRAVCPKKRAPHIGSTDDFGTSGRRGKTLHHSRRINPCQLPESAHRMDKFAIVVVEEAKSESPCHPETTIVSHTSAKTHDDPGRAGTRGGENHFSNSECRGAIDIGPDNIQMFRPCDLAHLHHRRSLIA